MEQTTTSQVTPWQTATTIKKDDHSKDGFVISAKKNDFSFLDVLLVPRIKQQLLSQDNFAGHEELVEGLAPTVAGRLRSAFSTMTGALNASTDQDNVTDMKFRYPNELNLIFKASRLRNDGKSNEQILEILKGEMDAALLGSV